MSATTSATTSAQTRATNRQRTYARRVMSARRARLARRAKRARRAKHTQRSPQHTTPTKSENMHFLDAISALDQYTTMYADQAPSARAHVQMQKHRNGIITQINKEIKLFATLSQTCSPGQSYILCIVRLVAFWDKARATTPMLFPQNEVGEDEDVYDRECRAAFQMYERIIDMVRIQLEAYVKDPKHEVTMHCFHNIIKLIDDFSQKYNNK